MIEQPRRLISIVIPCYNEAECLHELVNRVRDVFEEEPGYEFEVVVVDNGSHDESWSMLETVAANDERFKPLQLSRNFGADGAVFAGLSFISGEACVIMMADLEEPPELIPRLIRKWEEGYENVYGVVEERTSSHPLRKLNTKIFYAVASRLTGNTVMANVSDFRLVDRKVYSAVLSMSERNQFLRGMFSWVGFSSVGVPFKRDSRFAGVSKADTSTVLRLAMRGILSNSTFPLRLITLLGFLSSFASVLILGTFIIRFLLSGVPFDGFGTIVGLNLLGFSVLALSIGFLGEYLGLTYEETKRRPQFIVRNGLQFFG